MSTTLRLAATTGAVIWWAATWALKCFIIFAHGPIIHVLLKLRVKIAVVRSNSLNGAKKLYANAPLPHRKTMLAMRKAILEVIPDAEEVVSYGMPAFKLNGKIVAGLMAAKNHVGYYPFSGSILPLFEKELAAFSKTKSALHVPVNKPLSKSLIRKLLSARISQCANKNGQTSKSKYENKDQFWKSIGLAAPARRGLVDNRLYKLEDLSSLTERELKEIHAIGPTALKLIKRKMQRENLRFKH